PARLLGHIDRMLDGEPIAVEGPEIAEGAIGHDPTFALADEHRIALANPRRMPGPAVVDIDNGVVPDRRRVRHRVVVDRGDRAEIGIGGGTNDGGHGGAGWRDVATIAWPGAAGPTQPLRCPSIRMATRPSQTPAVQP